MSAENNHIASVDLYLAVTSVLAASVSLIVSLIALKISRKIYIYSSKDYFPEIVYTINDSDELEVVNRSKDLFPIKSLNFIKIIIIGFEDSQMKTLTEIPFIVRSIHCWWLGDSRKIVIRKSDAGPCAYQLCPYNSDAISEIQDRIYSEYHIDSPKGFALPSLQSVKFLLEIAYENQFKERKSIFFKKEHFHGTGFDNARISEHHFHEILKHSTIPKFDTIDELWNFLVKKYSYTV